MQLELLGGQGLGRREYFLKGMSMETKSVMSPSQDTREFTRARAQAASRACNEAEERLKSMERVYPLRDHPLYHEAMLTTMVAFVNFCEAMSLHDTVSVERYRTMLARQQLSMDVYKREYFPGGCRGGSGSHDLVLPKHACMIPACRTHLHACPPKHACMPVGPACMPSRKLQNVHDYMRVHQRGRVFDSLFPCVSFVPP